MELALKRSGRPREEIGYVNYHGTSTMLNDAVESRCVRRVFGSRAERMPGIVDQVDDRPPAGRERRRRRRHRRAGDDARRPAADDQPDRSGSGLRPGFHPERRAPRRRSRPRSATVSGSDRRTARWCSGGGRSGLEAERALPRQRRTRHHRVRFPRPLPTAPEPVVWALDAAHLRNYLLPRDCPRVTFYAGPQTTEADRARFLRGSAAVIVIEDGWLSRLRACRLYCYHLPAEPFECVDDCAGMRQPDAGATRVDRGHRRRCLVN